LHCAASCNNLAMVRFLVEHGACIFATTLSDQETAAEKCEEDEEGFDGCSEFLYSEFVARVNRLRPTAAVLMDIHRSYVRNRRVYRSRRGGSELRISSFTIFYDFHAPEVFYTISKTKLSNEIRPAILFV